RKLEATHQNLLRVTDIISEVRRQMNALERQVKKTRTFKTLQEEARTLELRMLIVDYRADQTALTKLVGNLNGLRTDLSARMAELSRTQTELHNVKTALIEKEANLSTLKQSCHDTQILIQRQENRIELLRGQIQSWNEQRDRLGDEQIQIGESILRAEGAEGETALQLEAEAGKLAGQEKVLGETEARLAGAEAESTRHQATLDEMKTRLLDTMSSLAQLKNESAGLESRKKEIGRIQEKGRLELSSTEEKRELARTNLSVERIHGGEFVEAVKRLTVQQGSLSDELGEKEALSQTLAEGNLRLREELTVLQARLASLRENEKAMTLSQAGIHSILKDQPDLQNRLHGIVADLLEVSPEVETAIEAVLGDQLQGMLTDDHGTTRDIVRQLKSDRNGRGLFMPRAPRVRRFSSPLPGKDSPGVIGPLMDQVRVRSGFESVAGSLLGGVLLVRDMDTALALWRADEIDYSIVTLEGEYLEPTGMLRGGAAGESDQGLLQTRR
ncbi:MAG TPA: hypothetical protein VLB09_01625, partial [Nitrospiria bacterium]|nr:hypothetical protein [Nitrospiria bacterium]